MSKTTGVGAKNLEGVLDKLHDIEVKVKRLHPDAKLPEYKTDGSVGMDLFSCGNYTVYAQEQELVGTGIAIAIPKGYEGQVRPRSGLAAEYEISITNSPGTIDSDYRGEIQVILRNNSPDDFEVKKGDRIAQIVFKKVEIAKILEVGNLDNTTRGEGGFGSTGYK